jgi:hypothetical protein
MKEQYVAAQMELIEFPVCDIITTSTDTIPTPGGWPLPGEGEQGDEWL